MIIPSQRIKKFSISPQIYFNFFFQFLIMASCSPYYSLNTCNTESFHQVPSEVDFVWLLDTIQELCRDASRPEIFKDISAELYKRGFIAANVRESPQSMNNLSYVGNLRQNYELNQEISKNYNLLIKNPEKHPIFSSIDESNSITSSQEDKFTQNTDSYHQNEQNSSDYLSLHREYVEPIKHSKSFATLGSPFAQVYSTLGTITKNEYDTVLKVQNLIDKQVYAIKISKSSVDEIPSAMREVQSLAALKSPRLVRYFSSWIEEIPNTRFMSFYIQTEFVEGQSLKSFLQAHRTSNSRDTLEYHRILLDMMIALHEIHSAGIVHRDFRPTNVMFRSDGSIVVIGFGISASPKYCRKVKRRRDTSPPESGDHSNINKSTSVTSLDKNAFVELCIGCADTACQIKHQKLGNPIYASPQQLNGRRSSPSDDIYSFGIIMYELLSDFSSDSEKIKFIRLLRNSAFIPENFRKQFPDEAELILKITCHDASARPTSYEILNSDLFKSWRKDLY
ncbi:AGC family protein kinase [Tritrichomonas foetus]|uniref:AGC family protein kinase n=1 Tax=Tritrichomonas foetus TaxID=1144522 RepID=A0A1J4JEM1_9EUKA|nr:AGC family protein kinase [Tritrichomonas foetus]|eukprot:OHS97602.1 AGC family protein kinase [Tritrichomonas foetus]